MTFLNSLNYWFNKISPIEIHHIDQPKEFKAIDKYHQTAHARLADRTTQLQAEKYLLLEVVSMVKRVALFSALQSICMNHQRDFRLATEGDKDAITKVDDYLKEKGYTESDLDTLTQKIMEDVGNQFPSLEDLYCKSKEILNG